MQMDIKETHNSDYTIHLDSQQRQGILIYCRYLQSQELTCLKISKPIYHLIDEKPLNIELRINHKGMITYMKFWGRNWHSLAVSCTLITRKHLLTIQDIRDILQQYPSLNDCIQVYHVEQTQTHLQKFSKL